MCNKPGWKAIFQQQRARGKTKALGGVRTSLLLAVHCRPFLVSQLMSRSEIHFPSPSCLELISANYSERHAPPFANLVRFSRQRRFPINDRIIKLFRVAWTGRGVLEGARCTEGVTLFQAAVAVRSRCSVNAKRTTVPWDTGVAIKRRIDWRRNIN